MEFVKRVWSRVPAFVKKDGAHVALVFGAAFVGSAKPLLPAVFHSPDVSTAKALVLAAVTAGVKAGVRAAQPVAVAFVVKTAYFIVAKVEASKVVSVAPAPAAATASAPLPDESVPAPSA